MRKILFSIVTCLLFTASLEAKTIVIAADRWCPFNCEPNSEHPGVLIEIAKYAFEKEGYTVEYRILPWLRAVKAAREGVIDGVIGAVKSEVPEFIFPEKEQLKDRSCFYVNNNNSWFYRGVESFAFAKLGVISGYSYTEEIDHYIDENTSSFKVTEISGPENLTDRLTKLLLLKRVDVIIKSRVIQGYYFKQHNQINNIKEAGCLAQDEKIYIAFTPKKNSSKKYAQILSKGIVQMQRSGKLQQILTNYGIEAYK